MKKKRKKKKKKGAETRMGWATAQLCHNTMGNCIVTQQVLGGLMAEKLRHDTNFVSWLGGWNDWILCRNTPSVS